MIKVDMVQIKNASAYLQREAPRALTYAARQTLNDAAYHTRRMVAENLPSQFTLRNTWTTRSMRFEKTKELDISKMVTRMGTTLQYMAEQEDGRINVGTGKEGLPIPTPAAANQTGRKRTKPVLPTRRVRNIQLRQKELDTAGMTRKEHNTAVVRAAAARKWRYVFLKLDRVKGIFLVKGTKNKPQVTLIHNMNKKTTLVPPTQWLEPAFKRVRGDIPSYFEAACEYQIARRAYQAARRRL